MYYLLLVLVSIITALATSALWEVYKWLTTPIRERHTKGMFYVDITLCLTIIVLCIVVMLTFK